MPRGSVEVDYELCMACDCCVQACPFSYLEAEIVGIDVYNNAYPHLNQDHQCTACGLCIEACPVDCIHVAQ